MSGICGVLHFGHRPAASAECLRHMLDAMVHRGAEEFPVFLDRGVGLGFRGSVIRDKLPGHRLLRSSDATLALAFDGEIDNLDLLQKKLGDASLEEAGDLRLLFPLYRKYGERMVDLLDGAFAFALWDQKQETLLCARDHVGQRPLFYASMEGTFLFASELPALLRVEDGLRDLDAEAFVKYLAYGYVPPPRTMLRKIRQIPPAHLIRVDVSGGMKTNRYWVVPFGAHGGSGVSQKRGAALRATVKPFFDEAVRRRLPAEGPIAILLSGGLDSSAVAATAKSAVGERDILTFSTRFEERDFDESPYVDLVAGSLGIGNEKIGFTSEDLIGALPCLVNLWDAPCPDPAAVTRYLLAGFASQRADTLLTGDGGDELFIGYPTFLGRRLLHSLRFLPDRVLRRSLEAAARGIRPSFSNFGLDVLLQLLPLAIGMEPEVMAQIWTSGLRQDSLSLLTGDDGLSVENCFAEVVDLVGEHRRRGLVHPLDRMQDFYFRFFLPYDLSKLERAVAAHGIQARSPLLDRALIAQVASLPPPVRFRGLRFKPILKQIMRGELPPPILHRTKRGFSVPLGRWMRGDMRDFVSDTLHSKTLGDLGLVRQASVYALLRDHLTGARDNRKELWALVTFILWAREHLFRGKP